MNSTPPTITPEEQEQLLQTIEMFEVIVQANPQDCQSMEILKDAYARLGMRKETVAMAKKLAQTYTELSQFAQAIQEYEGILKQEPDNVEIIAAMGDVEERMHRSGRATASMVPTPAVQIDSQAVFSDSGTLMATTGTQRMEPRKRGPNIAAPPPAPDSFSASPSDDGNESLARFLLQHRLAKEEAVHSALEVVIRKNLTLAPDTLGISLIDEVVAHGGGDMETILCGVHERTRLAYIPLEYYDVDRQVVRMLPEHLTLSRLMVPFDVMSRTIMIATANPFDSFGKESAQQLLDYNIQWHLASAESIIRVLKQVYRLGDAVTMPTITITPAPAPSKAEGGKQPAAAVPLPEIKVAADSKPLHAADGETTAAPLPDTSAFRLKT
jgi:tetratricopeptide (TPR) repeat protein